jgi:glycosyltransferase involved in cell wall biosynthesis
MKVLLIAGYAPSLINFRGPLISSLIALGHQVCAVAPLSGGDLSAIQKLTSLGATFSAIPLVRGGLNPFADIRGLWSLYRLLRYERPDLVLAYTIKPVIYTGLAVHFLRFRAPGKSPRLVSMITGLGYAFTTGKSTSIVRTLLLQLVTRLCRVGLQPAAAVIFQNPDDQATFQALKLISPTAGVLRVWGSGVDLASFPPQPLPRKPVFLMLARLLADKGIREYVSAARRVKQYFPQASFQLAGMLDSNPAAITQHELDAWIREGVIDYLGDLHHVQPALAACRFYVLPSYREGTPRSVLEALATARPVITTDAPGCRETVVHGVNGLLVPPRGAEALAAAMVQLIEQPDAETERMAQASLELARERFDVHKVNAQLLAVMGA